jgi:hypothetical protein
MLGVLAALQAGTAEVPPDPHPMEINLLATDGGSGPYKLDYAGAHARG